MIASACRWWVVSWSTEPAQTTEHPHQQEAVLAHSFQVQPPSDAQSGGYWSFNSSYRQLNLNASRKGWLWTICEASNSSTAEPQSVPTFWPTSRRRRAENSSGLREAFRKLSLKNSDSRHLDVAKCRRSLYLTMTPRKITFPNNPSPKTEHRNTRQLNQLQIYTAANSFWMYQSGGVWG